MSKDVRTWPTWTTEEIEQWHKDNPEESQKIHEGVYRQQKEAEKRYPLANDGT